VAAEDFFGDGLALGSWAVVTGASTNMLRAIAATIKVVLLFIAILLVKKGGAQPRVCFKIGFI
jgi:hypothetical protein